MDFTFLSPSPSFSSLGCKYDVKDGVETCCCCCCCCLYFSSCFTCLPLFFVCLFVTPSVGEQEDIEGLALETDCLPQYVAKGIALGCFVYARCLHHGSGVEQSREQAKHWYSRVCTHHFLLFPSTATALRKLSSRCFLHLKTSCKYFSTVAGGLL